MTNTSTDGVRYVTANQAVEYIAPHAGSRYQARLIIADAMHSGELTTTADTMWYIEDIDPADEWNEITKGAKIAATDVELPSDYWMSSGQWPAETRHWRWKEGNFLLNTSETPFDPFYGEALGNVQFDHTQVAALVGKTDRTGAGGRQPDRKRWSRFWVNFLYDCAGDLFDWTQFENKNQLKQAMLASSPTLFAESNLDDAVNAAWEGLVVRCARERLASDRARVSGE